MEFDSKKYKLGLFGLKQIMSWLVVHQVKQDTIWKCLLKLSYLIVY